MASVNAIKKSWMRASCYFVRRLLWFFLKTSTSLCSKKLLLYMYSICHAIHCVWCIMHVSVPVPVCVYVFIPAMIVCVCVRYNMCIVFYMMGFYAYMHNKKIKLVFNSYEMQKQHQQLNTTQLNQHKQTNIQIHSRAYYINKYIVCASGSKCTEKEEMNPGES